MDKPKNTANKNGLVTGYLLDGQGSGRKVEWDEINQWTAEQALLWVNLDYASDYTHEWIKHHSHLEPIIIGSLLAEHATPRCFLTVDGILLNLRSGNFSPDNLEDMVSIRIWIEKNRIISLQRHHLFSVDELVKTIKQGIGPRTAGEFIADIATEILEKTNAIINAIEKKIDDLEDALEKTPPHKIRHTLALCRRRIISIRRYMIPQRDALLRVQTDKISWLNDLERARIREVADRTSRYIEDLDAARDRATIIQEELISRTSEQINNKIYVLSLVAVIFMPLSFLVGLLGINVGGIPGRDSVWGFATVCGITIVVLLLEWYLLKRKKWL